MLTSHQPPMMVVSVGLQRFSLGLIRQAREFVIAFPSHKQAKEAFLFGTKSGRTMDKLSESGIATSPAAVIDCVLLDEAVANFELKLICEMQTGDHVIFAGEVVASHVNPEETGRLYTIGKGFKMSGISVNAPDTTG